MKKNRSATFFEYLGVIMKWRIFILKSCAAITMTTAILTLMLPQKFTATATILPPSQEQEAMIGLLTSGLSSGLSGLARMGSFVPGMSTPSDLFAAIMASGRIKSAIINKYDLIKEFKVKNMTDANEALGDITTIDVSPEGIISVSITYTDKILAADIANSYMEELDKFNNETAMTTGKKYRIFIEERLMATVDTLTQAENTLRSFQEKHHTIALDVEVEKAISTIADLKSRIILLEVKKGVLSSGSSLSNPHVYSLNKEIRELKKQLAEIELGGEDSDTTKFGVGFSVPFSELPQVSLEYFRLVRDVKVQEVIYELMAQQYEQAKIMELKDTPTVQILDRASPPEKRSWPKRSVIVFIIFLTSLFCTVVIALIVEKYNTHRIRELWLHVFNTLYKDFKSLKSIIKR